MGHVNVLDVGAYIGSYSISLATAARRDGLKVKFHTFEPGATLDLARINVDFNDLADWITVHACAISDVDGYTFYHANPGHSIGGQIFHPGKLSMHRIVKTRTIDTLNTELNLSAPALIKLDTQGHEPAIMSKAASIIERKSAVWQIEYIAWAARRRVEGEQFSEFLLRRFDCFDLLLHSSPKRLNADEMDQLISRMEAEKKFTDLLLVPKGAEFASAVLEQVEAIAANAR
jgi:FkbM family methyltransferase